MPGFDYSKWDRLELSDDEDNFHPNLDKGSNIRVNRITRERKEDEIDEEQARLREKGDHSKAEILEASRPLHAGNICRVAEERTLIQQAGRSKGDIAAARGRDRAFDADEYTNFVREHEAVLGSFEAATDLEAARDLLIQQGHVLLEEYANSYFGLTALDEEMAGNEGRVRRLCRQGQIISQITQIAEPVKRHPRDLVQRFFGRILPEGESTAEARDAFEREVEEFRQRLATRALEKRREEEEGPRAKAAEDAASAGKEQRHRPVKLVEAMYSMPREERLGPGGLDPVEVMESLPEALQTCFKNGDVELLKELSEEMDPDEFEQHFERCCDSGLWKDG